MSVRRPALFPSAFHPHKGGVEELTRQLALEQQRRGLDPVIVTMLEPKTLPAREMVDGLEVLRYRFRTPEPKPRFLAGWALHSRRTQQQIIDDLRARQVDLIHVQCVSNNARYALAAARDLDVPLVVSMQGEIGMDATGIYQRSAEMRRSWRRLVDAAEVVTSCSGYVLAEAELLYGESLADKATVVHNGINLTECRNSVPQRRRRPYILGLGRLVPQKGYDILIDAYARSDELRRTHDLLIAGDGPVLSSLKRQASERGITVEFLGAVEHGLAMSLMAGSDIFVLASRHEPQGIVALEALACGATVAAADVGGVAEVLNRTGGSVLFRPGDSAALAEALVRTLAIRKETPALELDDFDWATITSAYLDLYRLARSAGASTRRGAAPR